ncbi:MAG: anthranilate synthase component I [Gammaproteobacteria bacterium]|nr:MAG: anthranilate synthase component I [Gammaproteobacteria bacterium]
MNLEQFQALVDQGFNRIPIVREVLADLDTPLSTYQKLANGPFTYLLESVQGGEKWGRYSIIGLPCHRYLKIVDHDAQVICHGEVVEEHKVEDPLLFVEQFKARYRVPEDKDLPRFNGGLVGYFGYDTIRFVEKRLQKMPDNDPIGTPDILLMVSDEVVVFDNLRGSISIIKHLDGSEPDAFEKGHARLEQLVAQLKAPYLPGDSDHMGNEVVVSDQDFVSDFGQAEFEQAVDKIKEYVLAGDVMQVVLSQRMTIDYHASPLALYRALRYLNPSPYLYFYDFGEFHVVGSSPEILARAEHGKIAVRPLAGTRKRGKTEADDLRLEKELLADPKEIAEHLMLIDLGRNDIGRVAEVGSIEVSEQMTVERYSHVMHIVSNVEGDLKQGCSALDVLRATFPAGTLSGAPKVRAMEIIDELESVKRGIYGGAVGYLSWNGDMDTAIAIRTAVIKGGKLYIQAGAGVVADSVPRMEWEETLNKGRAIFRAVAMASNGLIPS